MLLTGKMCRLNHYNTTSCTLISVVVEYIKMQETQNVFPSSPKSASDTKESSATCTERSFQVWSSFTQKSATISFQTFHSKYIISCVHTMNPFRYLCTHMYSVCTVYVRDMYGSILMQRDKNKRKCGLS